MESAAVEAESPPGATSLDLDALVAAVVVDQFRRGADARALAPTHDHDVAPRDDWPWLPTREHRHLAIHPYCSSCGGVKYVGSERARPLGGVVNLAAALRTRLAEHGRKVTDAQMRLILARLRAAEVADRFTQSRATQDTLLLDAFSHSTGVDPDVLASFLRSG